MPSAVPLALALAAERLEGAVGLAGSTLQGQASARMRHGEAQDRSVSCRCRGGWLQAPGVAPLSQHVQQHAALPPGSQAMHHEG